MRVGTHRWSCLAGACQGSRRRAWRGVEIKTANVHEAVEPVAVLPLDPGDVHGDNAVAGDWAWRAIRARGGTSCAVHTHTT